MNPFAHRFAVLVVCAACAPVGFAQDAYPQPAYPAPVYQPAPAYGVQQGYPVAADDRKGRMRQFFAGTLATVLQGTGAPQAIGISDMVVGGIANWFDRKQRRKQERRQAKAQTAGQPIYPDGQFVPQAAGAPAYAPSVDANAPTYTPAPQYSPDPQYAPAPQYAADAAPVYAADPGQQYAPVQFYDAQTGNVSAAPAYAAAFETSPIPGYAPSYEPTYAPAGAPLPDNTLYAGIAYEIHALRADGSAFPVNPATYEFHSGDQFVVLYRPSLPGRMRVVNVNPAGRETEIDNVDVAAGQLLRLGPYRFEATRGDESLRFTITPCTSQALLVATRDIVKVDGASQAATFAGLNLGSCSSVGTRSIRGPATRDIRKVAVEGDTAFAFDPVSQQELAGGQLAPRELNVMFRHR